VNFFLAKIFQRQICKDSSKDNVYTTILLARNGSQAPPPKKKRIYTGTKNTTVTM